MLKSISHYEGVNLRAQMYSTLWGGDPCRFKLYEHYIEDTREKILRDNYGLRPQDAGVFIQEDFWISFSCSYLHLLLLLSEDCEMMSADTFVILSGVQRAWLFGCHL